MKKLSAIVFLFVFSVSFAQSAGDLIVTEIMKDPRDVGDTAGEWFEIYNTTSSSISLDGMVVSDAGSNSFTISSGVSIDAGQFMVLGRNSNVSTNGGVPVDYQYSGMDLGNSDDEIILTTSGGVEIDRVEYDNGSTFPDLTGASMVFIGEETDDNNDGSNWAASTARINFSDPVGDETDLGSPGVQGPANLPVELISFEASYVGSLGCANLSWATATEKNNYGFEIERSIDGSEFGSVDFVEGKGNSSSTIEYSYVDNSLPVISSLSYRLKQIDNDGSFEYSKIIDVDLNDDESVTGVDDEAISYQFSLDQNYPNPFNPSTTIRFTIPQDISSSASAKLTVFNALGEEVAVLVNGSMAPGQHEVHFNAGNLSSGIYFYQLKYGEFAQTKKLMLMK